VRRGRAPQHRKESNADAERRCTQNTLMLPCGSKTVDHAFDIDGHALPASSHRWSGDAVPIRVFCVHRLAASATKIAITDVHPTVMAGHVPATSRDRLSLRMAGTCPAMTVERHAAGIFTLSWCPRAGRGDCAEILPLRCCRPTLTDASQGPRRRTGIWRYTTLPRPVVWSLALLRCVLRVEPR